MKAVVTGGGGFLGGAVTRLLRQRGDSVRSFTRSRYPWLDELGVEQSLGDLANLADVERAVTGCDVVFHVAAKAGVGGRYSAFFDTNVTGTQNVLDAMWATGVARLVYTSTPSVVFDGRDQAGIDERAPYPARHHAHYPETKAIAERAVLAANGPALATVALRPHLIWGPRDNHLVPRVLARARAGVLRRVGDGMNLVDSTYIDNAADAHILAADRLAPGAVIGGKAYFISNGEPRPLFDLVNRILAAGGLPPVTKSVPRGVARAVGLGLEVAYGLLRLKGEPRMTRFLADELASAHWFDITAARRDLGYEPKVSIDEGFVRLANWLREAPISPRTGYPS